MKVLLNLSVVIPVYNERETLAEIVQAVLATEMAYEIILVDDGSKDGTRDLYPQIEALAPTIIRVILHEKNLGKGGALQTGFRAATGDIIIIQDADLEYDPRDYPAMIRPIVEGKAAVVYGSRFRGGPSKTMFFMNMVGNKFLTLMANILYNTILTDIETCYKAFRPDVIKGIPIRSRGFDFEPEITAKVLKRGIASMKCPFPTTAVNTRKGRRFGRGAMAPLRCGALLSTGLLISG